MIKAANKRLYVTSVLAVVKAIQRNEYAGLVGAFYPMVPEIRDDVVDILEETIVMLENLPR